MSIEQEEVVEIQTYVSKQNVCLKLDLAKNGKTFLAKKSTLTHSLKTTANRQNDRTKKSSLAAKPIKRQLYKNKYQMPNVNDLLVELIQIVTENEEGTLFFRVISKVRKQSDETSCAKRQPRQL